jgi:hypothetical protein
MILKMQLSIVEKKAKQSPFAYQTTCHKHLRKIIAFFSSDVKLIIASRVVAQ